MLMIYNSNEKYSNKAKLQGLNAIKAAITLIQLTSVVDLVNVPTGSKRIGLNGDLNL